MRNDDAPVVGSGGVRLRNDDAPVVGSEGVRLRNDDAPVVGKIKKDELQRLKYLYSEKVEKYLDSGYGECVLRRDGVRDILVATLRHDDEGVVVTHGGGTDDGGVVVTRGVGFDDGGVVVTRGGGTDDGGVIVT